MAPRPDDIEYDVEVAGDRLFIVHNDGAPDFELAEAPLTSTEPADWTTIWPGDRRPAARRQSPTTDHLVHSPRAVTHCH